MSRRIRTQADVEREQQEFINNCHRAAWAIARNLSAYRGVGNEWDNLSEEVKEQIVGAWAALIVAELS